MKEYNEVFTKLKIDDTGFFKKGSGLWRYCFENKIITLQDLIIHVEEQKCKNKHNLNIITLNGLIKLFKYKYLGIFTDSIIALLNSSFKSCVIDNKNNINYSKFCDLGLTLYECWYIYNFSNIYSVKGKAFIDYIKEIIALNNKDVSSNFFDKLNFISNYYDAYKLNQERANRVFSK